MNKITLSKVVFTIGLALLTASKAYSFPANAVKWHPGHYYTVFNNEPEALTINEELKANQALRGLQVRFAWSELETTEGLYNFSKIESKLAELAGIKKHLIILLQTKSFAQNVKFVPDYLLTDTKYEGGIYRYGTSDGKISYKGDNIKLWNSYVRDRLNALVSELGKRFNNEVYFEGMGLSETDLGLPQIPLTSTQKNGYFANLINVNEKMRMAFPNTVTLQSVNYPQDILATLVGGLKTKGAGLSTSGVFPDDPTLAGTNAIYSYFPKMSGFIPIAPQISYESFNNTSKDGSGHKPTLAELLTYARDNLKSNYIFWSRHKDYNTELLSLLNLDLQKNDPIGAGGLKSQCPSVYPSCSGPVKYHPGHYYTLIMPSNIKYEDSYLSKVYSELDATPRLHGAQIRYHWRDLEPEEGKYNFTKIDKHLAGLASHQKRLVVLIQIKSFDLVDNVVPAYVRTTAYDGGQITYVSSLTGEPHGYLIKLWNDKIRARLNALLQALGNRYNAHPYFEAIGFTESSSGINLTDVQNIGYYDGLLLVDQSARKHFPNTTVYQFVNHTRKYLESFITTLKNMGASLGGPDILPTDLSLTIVDDPKSPDGVYSYYPKLSGTVPLMPSIQPIDYRYTSARKSEPGHVPTLQELYDYGKDNLQANYLYWTRDVDYYLQVLNFLKQPQITSTPSGGLGAGCPSAYIDCIRN